jgi:hypothetical protein
MAKKSLPNSWASPLADRSNEVRRRKKTIQLIDNFCPPFKNCHVEPVGTGPVLQSYFTIVTCPWSFLSASTYVFCGQYFTISTVRRKSACYDRFYFTALPGANPVIAS